MAKVNVGDVIRVLPVAVGTGVLCEGVRVEFTSAQAKYVNVMCRVVRVEAETGIITALRLVSGSVVSVRLAPDWVQVCFCAGDAMRRVNLVSLLQGQEGRLVWSPVSGCGVLVRVGDLNESYPLRCEMMDGQIAHFTAEGFLSKGFLSKGVLKTPFPCCLLWPAPGVYSWDDELVLAEGHDTDIGVECNSAETLEESMLVVDSEGSVETKKSEVCRPAEAIKVGEVSPLSLSRVLRNRLGCIVWSPLVGECRISSVTEGVVYSIRVVARADGDLYDFTDTGCYFDYVGAECVLWPAKGCYDWDGGIKLVRWRAAKGDSYWFINDCGKVRRAVERYECDDDSRWDLGNYFASSASAGKAAGALITSFFEKLERVVPQE